jgi:hypothetical protein
VRERTSRIGFPNPTNERELAPARAGAVVDAPDSQSGPNSLCARATGTFGSIASTCVRSRIGTTEAACGRHLPGDAARAKVPTPAGGGSQVGPGSSLH